MEKLDLMSEDRVVKKAYMEEARVADHACDPGKDGGKMCPNELLLNYNYHLYYTYT